jgi:hypothetical protein
MLAGLAVSGVGYAGAAAPAAFAGMAEAADTCPNAAVRAAQGSDFVADCRAWEMVSPPAKNNADISLGAGATRASASGDAVMFDSNGAFPPAQGTGKNGMVTYLARRGDGAWSSEGITPPHDPDFNSGVFTGPLYPLVADDLSKAVVYNADPQITPDSQSGIRNLYLRDNLTGGFKLLSRPFAPLPSAGFADSFYTPNVTDATPDFGHVTFQSTKNLTENASGSGDKLYEWDHGTLRLAGVLPGETAPDSAVAGAGYTSPSGGFYTQQLHTISRDGSKIFFTDGTSGGLYMRVDHSSTVRVNDSENRTTAISPEAATFLAATPSGAEVFFISAQQLVDADVNTSADLYAYDTTKPAADPHNLTLLSRGDHPAGDPSDVLGLLGASDDGQSVYFAAAGRLVAGQPVTDASHTGIYLWQSGQLRYVASIGDGSNSGDEPNWATDSFGLAPKLARVTPDGRVLLFSTTVAQPGGYDNAGQREFYRYDAPASTVLDPSVVCVSCSPSGASATGPAEFIRNITGGPPPYAYWPRALSDDGRRVFFHTPDALDARDVNGKLDVYEWEDGTVHLLSAGHGDSDTFFVDASADGDSVYLQTNERLSGWDDDANRDLYVARVGGGLSEPPVVDAPPCTGDRCQGDLAPAVALATVGSVTFRGPGNTTDAPSTHGSVSVSKLKPVTGTMAVLKVTVPTAGVITLSSSSVRKAKRSASKAATYSVRASLSSKAKALLKRKHTLKVTVTVQFTPKAGRSVTQKVTLTFKQPKAKKKGAR